MEVIINKIQHHLHTEDYIKGTSCFMDIETTGFSRDNNMIYLIGLLYLDKDGKWILKQYFANSKDKEINILEKFIEEVEFFDNIITYNGDSFDLPFINHRLKLLGSDYSISNDKSFDLYRLLRKNKDFLNLENLKLKTIEESLGYYREDIYSGYECISFYKNYLVSGKLKLKNRVLKHNYDDLIHMLDIMKILDIIKSKKSFNIKVHNINSSWIIESLLFSKDDMEIKGFIEPHLPFDIKKYEFYYNLNTINKNQFYFQLSISQGFIEENVISSYIDLNYFSNLNLTCSYGELYSIPKNLFLLSINNNPIIGNIKLLISELLLN